MAPAEKESDAEVEPKKKGSKIILLAVILLIVAVVGGFAAWKFVLQKPGGIEIDAAIESEAQEDVGAEAESIMLPLDPFIVNLFDGKGVRYLKVKIEIQIKATDEEYIIKMTPKTRNSLIILLSSKKYAEIGSIEGKVRLRQEILYRLHRILGEGKVKDVFFTDFVVQ